MHFWATVVHSQASEQRTLWEPAFCPLFGGCPFLGGLPHLTSNRGEIDWNVLTMTIEYSKPNNNNILCIVSESLHDTIACYSSCHTVSLVLQMHAIALG